MTSDHSSCVFDLNKLFWEGRMNSGDDLSGGRRLKKQELISLCYRASIVCNKYGIVNVNTIKD